MDEVAVLVLNGSFEPLHFTNGRRAITLLLAGKAESVEPSPRVVRSPSRSFALPSVIRLMMYIRKPFTDRVAFNKKNILRRDHYACQYCGRRGERLTVDHVLPRSRGGDTTWLNVVAACLRCNLHKGNRTVHEAGMSLVREPSHPQFLFSIHLLRHPHASFFLDAWRKYLAVVPATLPTALRTGT
jgi:5-methylcytosine-specific restriction endonuclease McrA